MEDCEVRICLKGLEPFNLICADEEARKFFDEVKNEKFACIKSILINTSEIIAVGILN